MSDIKEGSKNYRIKTASGILRSSTVGTMDHFGEAVYLKEAPNLVALDEVEKRFKVEYVQGKYFKCYNKGNEMIKSFKKDPVSRMYISADVSIENTKINVFVDTVNDRISNYTAREVTDAKKAREAIRMLGFPGEGSLSYDIMSGGMINNPITPKSLKIAAEIFGKDVANLRGKMTVSNPIKNSMLEVETDTDQVQEMHTDVFEYRGQPGLLTVLSPLGLVLIYIIREAQTTPRMREILEGQIKSVTSRGFKISRINVDPAGPFMKMSKFPVLGIEVYPVGPNAHVRTAERAIRTLKDRARAVEYSLPWKLPKSLVQYLLSFVCIRLNQLARRSIGPRAPIERFTGRKLDFSRDVRAGFGDYVQIKVNPKHMNTAEPRTRGCIMLMPTNNLSGTHSLYSLDKGTKINADNWVALPTPDIVIEKMNQLALDEEKPKVKQGYQKKLILEEPELTTGEPLLPLTELKAWNDLADIHFNLPNQGAATENQNRSEQNSSGEELRSLPD